MSTFDERLMRLKRATGLLKDREIAEALGLSKAAFADRKKRESFPDDRLFALAAKRPDLRLDVGHILNGEPLNGEPLSDKARKFNPRKGRARGRPAAPRATGCFDANLLEWPYEQLNDEEINAVRMYLGGEPETVNGRVPCALVRIALRKARGRKATDALAQRLDEPDVARLRALLRRQGFIYGVMVQLANLAIAEPLPAVDLDGVPAHDLAWVAEGVELALGMGPHIRRRLRPVIERLLAQVQP